MALNPDAAHEARKLLESDMLRAAFASVDARAVEAWRRCSDPAERDRLHSKVQALEETKQEIFRPIEQAAQDEAFAKVPQPDRLWTGLLKRLRW